MLAPEVVNIIRLRNQSPQRQREARKWNQALDTLDWLTAQLPVGSRYQVIAFNTEADYALPETAGRWLEVADSAQIERVSQSIRDRLPTGGTSLINAFGLLSQFSTAPDNIFIITDGLPTQGDKAPRRNTVSGPERLNLFRAAVRTLPAKTPVNIFSPMERSRGRFRFWRLAQDTGGSFMAPAKDRADNATTHTEISLSFLTSSAVALARLSCY